MTFKDLSVIFPSLPLPDPLIELHNTILLDLWLLFRDAGGISASRPGPGLHWPVCPGPGLGAPAVQGRTQLQPCPLPILRHTCQCHLMTLTLHSVL